MREAVLSFAHPRSGRPLLGDDPDADGSAPAPRVATPPPGLRPLDSVFIGICRRSEA